MHLEQINIATSPSTEDRVRLVGKVSYDDGAVSPEHYWFEVPRKYAEFLSVSGNPWLVCLLPLAVTLGEAVRLDRPIDRTLLDNVLELMRIWKCWYPRLHIVPIEADVVDAVEHQPGSGTAAFFSGGVDSFFTVLRHNSVSISGSQRHIDDLLCVWGFDIPLTNCDAFRRLRSRLQRAASDLGKELIAVATNLRVTRLQQVDWGSLYFGSALASVALALEKRYTRALIAASSGYEYLVPWGSHPLTDPLLSTGRTKIIHDGAGFNRVERTALVARSEVAMRSLHVCWKFGSDGNCGACSKCYRTMAALELLGALGQCKTFPKEHFELRKLRKIHLHGDWDRLYFRQIRDLALRKGRPYVARAVERGFKYSDRLDRWLRIIRMLGRRRFLWRLRKLEHALLWRSIT